MTESTPAKQIMTLQPFYGGSHRQFIDGWIANSRHGWRIETLPDRHWKWRMRHAAIEFAGRVDALWQSGQRWDLFLTTDMLNVAEFLGLLRSEARKIPLVLYFHENQFEYPSKTTGPRDHHFAFTNLTSALAADAVWFNSRFNRDSMLARLEKMVRGWPDYQPKHAAESVLAKSSIQYPGIDVPVEAHRPASSCVHIVWAARWEHDKNPELLFEILNLLDDQGLEFKLSVVGQRYRNCPEVFDELQKQFCERIVNWGYLETREEYFTLLRSADVFLSTANHEFFGLSAAEAIAAGCVPVLPNRIVYPELLDVEQNPERGQLLYDSAADAAGVIRSIAENSMPNAVTENLSRDFRTGFCWDCRAVELDSVLAAVIKQPCAADEQIRCDIMNSGGGC